MSFCLGVVEVSVLLIAYNHSATIREAIDSVLAQDRLPDEIIVADDDSTDGTAAILAEYLSLYPRVIRLLPCPRNLGMQANVRRGLEACSGRFIALLEGDDYWIDRSKLRRQLEGLNERPDIDLCLTAGMTLTDGILRPGWDYGGKRIVSVRDLAASGGLLAPTASLVARASAWHDLPEFVWEAPAPDTQLILAAAREKGALFLPERTVVYRFLHPESWTARMIADRDAALRNAKRFDAAYVQAQSAFGLSRATVRRLRTPPRHVIAHADRQSGRWSSAVRGYLSLDPSYLLGLLRRRLTRRLG